MLKTVLCCLLCCTILYSITLAESGQPFIFASLSPDETTANSASPGFTPEALLGREKEALAFFREANVYGGTLIVTRGYEPLLRATYGQRDHKDHPVTLDTRFRVASVTKMVAAVGLMMLYDEGRFDLDAPIMDILPFRVMNPQYPNDPVTPRQTLTHTSSIIAATIYHPKWEELPKENRYFKPNTRPGSEYNYSNLNGGLIGAMIEALSGESLNTFMKERLFEPLGIDAAFNPGLLKNQNNISEMLLPDGSVHASVKKQLYTVNDYLNKCNPRKNTDHSVGSLYISAEGLSRIARMLASGGAEQGHSFLKEETVRLMEHDQAQVPGTSVVCESPYGLGMIRMEEFGAYPWYGHQGRYLGLVANVYYQPATGLTFTLIATGYDGASVDGIADLSRSVLNWVESVVNETSVDGIENES